jgi:YesN/AraC family two-component response regulator
MTMKTGFGGYRSGRFFTQLLLTNFVLVGGFMALFCAGIFMYSRMFTADLQEEANRKVLEQVNYNIDHLNDFIKNLAVSTFNDRDIVSLMNTRDQDIFQLYNKLARLDSTLNSNLFLDSIVVYNAFNGCSYSTSPTAPVLCGDNKEPVLADVIGNPASYPKFTMVPADLEKPDQQRVFVYTMYASTGSYNGRESMLVLTVKPDWLFDNVKAINSHAGNTLGRIFLFSERGRIIDSIDMPQLDESTRGLIADELTDSPESGSFVIKGGEGKQMVTYLRSGVSNWRMVSIQPYEEVFASVNRIGLFSFLALFILTVMSFLVSLWLSIRLYRPMYNLVSKFRKRHGDVGRQDEKDEWLFISSAYDQLSRSMEKLRDSKQSGKQVMRQYLQRLWITDSAAITEQQFGEYLLQGQSDQSYLLGLLKLDRYADFRTLRDESEQKLLRFAIVNIASDVMADMPGTQTTDMLGDEFAVLVPIEDAGQSAAMSQRLAERIRRIQNLLDGYYRLSLTAVISDTIAGYRQVSDHYARVKRLSLYRMSEGPMSLITPQFDENRSRLPEEGMLQAGVEAELAAALREGREERWGAALDVVFEHLGRLHCDSLDDALLHVLALIKQEMRASDPIRYQSCLVSVQTYMRRILEQETFVEARLLIGTMLAEFYEQRIQERPDRREYLVEAVKEMIENGYGDPNMCLQVIADELELSPRYLGRYFRARETGTVAEFLTDTRLKHALKYLEEGQLSVAEIMKSVGYTNESTFFQVFKKKIGMTPGEYRQLHQRTL